jgi:hypothetical protein
MPSGFSKANVDVADVLGNSPAIVKKQYAKWSKGRQERWDEASAASRHVQSTGKAQDSFLNHQHRSRHHS